MLFSVYHSSGCSVNKQLQKVFLQERQSLRLRPPDIQSTMRFIKGGLKQRGILVRHFDKPRISAWVRITVGTRAQMEALLRETKSMLEEADV